MAWKSPAFWNTNHVSDWRWFECSSNVIGVHRSVLQPSDTGYLVAHGKNSVCRGFGVWLFLVLPVALGKGIVSLSEPPIRLWGVPGIACAKALHTKPGSRLHARHVLEFSSHSQQGSSSKTCWRNMHSCLRTCSFQEVTATNSLSRHWMTCHLHGVGEVLLRKSPTREENSTEGEMLPSGEIRWTSGGEHHQRSLK